MTLHVPDEWRYHLDEITANPGVVVVVGDTDVGKTTFCTIMADHGLEAGVSTAIVDGDIGQSEIGPPTTIGLGLVDSPIQTMSDLQPRALYFVGSTSPVGLLLPTATGDKKLTEAAQALGRELVIVDTTGLVRGVLGRRLKTNKIELLRPRHIVALQRAGEAEQFLRFFDTWAECTVHRLVPSRDVHPKSQGLRSQRRAIRFQEYFRGAQVHDIPLEHIATSGTWLRTGNPLEPKYLRFAEHSLGTTVYHGEMVDKGVFLITGSVSSSREKAGVAELQEYFKTRSINIIPANRFANLVVGLLDSRLDVLSLGIIRGIDFRSEVVSVSTPLRTVTPVASMRFGILRLRPDGTEIVRLRPGDV
jgi:polynucleotide 5'-hydroxyl-kinase GRC3/NOL9